jgi:hypothetical protein
VNNSAIASHFCVERDTGDGFREIAVISATETRYDDYDISVTEPKIYNYRVRAYNQNINAYSQYSEPVPVLVGAIVYSSQPYLSAYACAPKIVIGDDGVIHVVYNKAEENKIYYTFSTDGGQHWSSPDYLGEGQSPAIILDETGTPHVLWIRCVDYPGARRVELWYAYKSNSGWSRTRVLEDAHIQPFSERWHYTVAVGLDVSNYLIVAYTNGKPYHIINICRFPLGQPANVEMLGFIDYAVHPSLSSDGAVIVYQDLNNNTYFKELSPDKPSIYLTSNGTLVSCYKGNYGPLEDVVTIGLEGHDSIFVGIKNSAGDYIFHPEYLELTGGKYIVDNQHLICAEEHGLYYLSV